MLNVLCKIILLDLLAMRRWFAKNTVSKIVVSLAYLFLLLLVAVGIFFWSNAFFRYLIGFEEFGTYTSEYILKGAFVILVWIGILSSLVSTIAFLITANRFTDFLLTLPISTLSVSLYHTLRSFFTNSLLFLASIFPLVMGFIYAQAPEGRAQMILGLLAALVLLVFLTESIGSSFAYLSVYLSKTRLGFFVNALSVLVLISATWLVIRVVFPPALRSLEDASAAEFLPLFNSLPLNSSCWLGNSFTSISMGIFSQSQYLLLFAFLGVVVSTVIKKTFLVPCRQGSRVTKQISKGGQPLISLSRMSLTNKDLLSILRSSQNLGYALFLIIMIVTFFGLFSRGYLVGTIPHRFRSDALAFSFSWLVFFSGTFLLRFVYPLMVNEGKSRWWFLTIPALPERLITSKIIASLLISSPLIIVAIVEWYLTPFTSSPLFMVVFSAIVITFLAVFIPLVGSIRPDYSLAYDADKASTTFTGVISVIVIVATGLLSSYLIKAALSGSMSQSTSINALLTSTVTAALFMWFVSKSFTRKYKLDT